MAMPDLSLRKILRRLLILNAPQVAQLILGQGRTTCWQLVQKY